MRRLCFVIGLSSGSFTMRQFERYPIRAGVSFEVLDQNNKGEGYIGMFPSQVVLSNARETFPYTLG